MIAILLKLLDTKNVCTEIKFNLWYLCLIAVFDRSIYVLLVWNSIGICVAMGHYS